MIDKFCDYFDNISFLMKSVLIISCLNLLSIIASAQVCIVYESENVFNLNHGGLDISFPEAKIRSSLYLYDTFSLWADDSLYVNKNEIRESRQVFVVAKEIYQLYNQHDIYYRDISNTFRQYSYQEPQELSWEVHDNESKEIIGFKCYRATRDSGGTMIEVWFTKELPYSSGPEFYGFNLPGTILELNRSNKYKSFKAVGIRTDDISKFSELPLFHEEEEHQTIRNNKLLYNFVPEQYVIKNGYPLKKWIDINIL